MKIGYIMQYDTKLNPSKNKFEFKEATFTRRITSKGDRVYSKMLLHPIDHEEIVDTAKMMKESAELIIVREPFLLDDELKDRVTKWVNWANNAEPSLYDPFCGVKTKD